MKFGYYTAVCVVFFLIKNPHTCTHEAVVYCCRSGMQVAAVDGKLRGQASRLGGMLPPVEYR